MARLDAAVGQRVKAGQLLAELDHAQDAQAQAEAGLTGAQAKLAQLQRGRAARTWPAAAQRTPPAGRGRPQPPPQQGGRPGRPDPGLEQQGEAAQQQANAAQQQAIAAPPRRRRPRSAWAPEPPPGGPGPPESQVAVACVRLAQAQSRDEEPRLAQTQVEARVALQQAQDGNRA